jgi:Zn-dependent protease
VPIPPLDGSRIVYAFAPDAVRAIFDQVEPFGFFIIIALLYLHGFDLLTNIYQMVLNLLGSI